jgi:TPR repeat protein
MKRILIIGFLVAASASPQTWADTRSGLRAMDVSDYATALKNLIPTAEEGDVTAQFALAKIYLYGWGVKKNEVEAAKWFRKAAEQGDPKARKMLAHIYEQGIGVQKNPAEAKKWRSMVTKNYSSSAQARSISPQQSGHDSISNEARAGRKLNQAEVATLEQNLKQNSPDDLAIRAQLLGYYYHKAILDISKESTIQARRRHILWIIENQPGSEIASLGEARIDPAGGTLADREGYERAKALWVKQAKAHNGKPSVMLNAASFLQLHDKPLAEDMLKKGEALNPQHPGWKASLGYLYGLGILGIDGLNPNGIPISVNLAEQDGTFARKALKEVETSTSAMLIGTTGAIVEQYGAMISSEAMRLSERDYGDLGEKLLLRAQSLEPGNKNWSAILGEMYSLKSVAAKTLEDKMQWSRKALEQMEKGDIKHISDPEWRMGRLGEISKVAFNVGEYQKAEKYAKELLALAEPHPADPRFGQAWHDGNMILGRLALKRGDVAKAKMHLLRAGHTPGGGTLTSFGPNMSLAKDLLEQGEKSTVIEYLMLCKKFWAYPRNPVDTWIQAIKSGQQPDFAQNLVY